jgi:hypothetical protein
MSGVCAVRDVSLLDFTLAAVLPQRAARFRPVAGRASRSRAAAYPCSYIRAPTAERVETRSLSMTCSAWLRAV